MFIDHQTLIATLSLTAALLAANPAGAEEAPPAANTSRDYRGVAQRQHYRDVQAAQLWQLPTGLCDISRKISGPAGLYRVEELIGVTEEVRGRVPGELDGFTYVELSLVTAWTPDAPSNPIVRMEGGPTARLNHHRGWNVALKQGELAGILFVAPMARNRGYYGLHNLAVFQRDPRSGGVTNGQLFTNQKLSFDELGKLVRAQRSRPTGTCPFDVYPPAAPAGPRGVEREGDVQVQDAVPAAAVLRGRPAQPRARSLQPATTRSAQNRSRR
jgi:hypothetical protein